MAENGKERARVPGGRSVKHNIPTIIIEERTLLREGLAALLNDTSYKVVANIASVSDIPDLKLSTGRAVLTLMGLSRGRDESLRTVQRVRDAIKGCKLVAVGERFSDHDFQEILKGGVDAIVFDIASSDALLKTLDLTFIEQQLVILARPSESESRHHAAPPLAVDHAVRAVTPEAASELGRKSLGVALVANLHTQMSEREQQVLICVARGDSNKTIARSCSISEATVKVHLQSILRKISARNRTQAALWAVENGLVAKTPLASIGVNGGGLLSDGLEPEAHCDLGAPKSRLRDRQ